MMTTTRHLKLMSLTAMLVLATPHPALAQEDEERLRKDLGTVIALQGKPCGKVTRATKRAENDYDVDCESGDRYRVKIDGNDRVVITKR